MSLSLKSSLVSFDGVPLETLLPWSDPQLKSTRTGPTLIRTANPTAQFWKTHERHKARLKKAGVRVSKSGRDWTIIWYLDPQQEAPVLEDGAGADAYDWPDVAVNEFSLREWQVDNLKRLKFAYSQGRKGLLDASDTGTGKTYTALALAREFGLDAYIVCPKAVIPAWRAAAREIGASLGFVTNYENLKTGKTQWLVYDSAEWPNWKNINQQESLIVFDEAHRCKANDNTINSQMLIMARKQGYTTLLLSATLAENPLHLRAAGYALGLHNLVSYWEWIETQGCRKVSVQDEKTGNWRSWWEFSGEKTILEKLHRQIFSLCGVRTRIHDLGERFPESLNMAQALDFGNVQSIYDEMEKALQKIEHDAKNYQANALAALMAARRKSEMMKVPGICEMVRDAVDEGNSVAIFLNFRETVSECMTRLKTGCVVQGEQDPGVRQTNIKNFQDDVEPVIVCNNEAGGVGISLHGKKPRIALISPTFNASTLKQIFGRVWRDGGSDCVQKILYAAGSVEEEICQAVKLKLSNIDTLNDGDCGMGLIERKKEK